MTDIVAFTIPRAFQGTAVTDQRNAILSWKLAGAKEVVLWGNDAGVGLAAQVLLCKHSMQVRRTANGTPTIDVPFAGMRAAFPQALLLYANCDIVFLSGILRLAEICSAAFPTFLATGRRWNAPGLAGKTIDFEVEGWHQQAWADAQVGGAYHRHSGEDWFLFPAGLYQEVPPFAIGRSAWDNWLLLDAQRRGVPTVDATEVVRVLHPGRGKVKPPRRDPDWQANQVLWKRLGGGTGLGYITTTSHVMREGWVLEERKI